MNFVLKTGVFRRHKGGGQVKSKRATNFFSSYTNVSSDYKTEEKISISTHGSTVSYIFLVTSTGTAQLE